MGVALFIYAAADGIRTCMTDGARVCLSAVASGYSITSGLNACFLVSRFLSRHVAMSSVPQSAFCSLALLMKQS